MVTNGNPLTDHLDLWTSALLIKSAAGRGSNGKQEAYGIKKLRELILELAVRGKLVPQDSNDEPAVELLKRTIAEKKRLIKEGQIREAKPPVFPVESPDHELPANWVWTNLFEIGEIAPRIEADDTLEASFVPMQALSEKYGVPVGHEVRTWGEIKSGFTHFREEDVALAKITPCFQNGKSAVMRGLKNEFGAGTTELHVYRSINRCTAPEYVLIYLKSPRFIGDGIPNMTGTAGQKRITRDYFAGNHFPLPPLAEQHRIVAKVDELMDLCDRLEQQQTGSQEAHQTLVETLLGTLTQSTVRAEPVEARPSTGSGRTEFEEAWARIADHFDTLFTTEHSIDQLKQTILQLAVMGKLVPQGPNDESVTILFEADEELIAQADFEIPHEWRWCRLHKLAEINGGFAFKSTDYKDEGMRVVRISDFDEFGFKDHKVVRHPFTSELSRFILDQSNILIAMTGGTVGKSYLVKALPEPMIVNQRVATIKVSAFTDPCYIDIVIRSEMIQDVIQKTKNSTNDNISMADIKGFSIPLPPLAEQHRIVAKVDEFMTLCDTLKARLKAAQATQINLADAIVELAAA